MHSLKSLGARSGQPKRIQARRALNAQAICGGASFGATATLATASSARRSTSSSAAMDLRPLLALPTE